MWEQELFEGFEYVNDKPFFHTFETDVSECVDLGHYSVYSLWFLMTGLSCWSIICG